MERSSSFHESMEHLIPSHQNMLSSTSPVVQSDVTNFFQCLRFDPKVVASDHKSIRQGDFEQLVYSALGIQGAESPSGFPKGKLISSRKPGEIKKLKAILRETNVKARECVKMFDEASSVFNKCFPSIPTKMMSQLEGLSGGCSGDHLVSGSGLGKMGIQGQTLAGDFELDLQKLSEQQSGVRYTRTRTARIGVQSNSIVQQSVSANRVRQIKRVANRNAVQGEEQTSIGIDGCEKSKMKNKRPCINGCRDLKQGTQRKSVGDSNMLRSSIRNDFNSSDISNTKTNVSVCGLKSGPARPPILFPGVQNTPPSNWGISGCTSKPPALAGVTDRKRTGSNRSSSPLASQCAAQRPQKISRVARTIVSDEVPNSDDVNPGSIETGFRLHKNSPAASPQLKLKGENNFCPITLSESEESGPPEIKSNETEKQFDEFDGKATQNNPKVSIPSLQSRKNNKPVASEKIGNGVRRQGRSLNPMGAEKNKNAKQHCGARHIFDRSESKLGRTPARKPLIIRTHNRQKVMPTDSLTVELQGSDIGDHINFLKHQEELSSMSPTPVQLSHEELATNREDSKACPLYQKLISALIPEYSISINEFLQASGLGAMHDLDNSEFNVLMKNLVDSNGRSNNERVELDESEEDGSATPFEGVIRVAHDTNGKLSDNSLIKSTDIQYDKLGLDEKILLELQCLGISLEPMPSIVNVEDDEIVEEIKNLEEAVCKEGSKKKEMVNKLRNSAIEMKELQEKEFYQHGHDKLIEMAYEKHKASRRRNFNKKISKQAASAFTTKALEQCHHFEETGKSCLSEPEIKEMFIAGLTRTEETVMDNDCNPSATTPISSQPSSDTRVTENCTASSDLQPSESALPEQTTGKDNTTQSTRAKKKELLVDVGIGTPLSSSIKRKRSETSAASPDLQPSESALPEPTTGKDETTQASRAKNKELLLDVGIGTPLSSSIKRKRTENRAASPDWQPSESALPEQSTGKEYTTRSSNAKKKELLLDDVGIRTPLSSSMKQKRSEPCAASPSWQPSESPLPEQTTGKDDTTRSTRSKKKELLQLDDVGIETSLPSSIRGKRSGRGRGRGLVRGRSNTNGRSSLPKGRRKPRPNKRQTTSKVSLPEPVEANGINAEENNQCTNNLKEPEEFEPLFDFSNLEIPEGIENLEDFCMPLDINSWLPTDDNTMDVDGL